MKTNLLLFCVILFLGITACKKKGCTDENANNYNALAKKDDGSCTFDETACPYDSPILYTGNDGLLHAKLPATIECDLTLTSDIVWDLSGETHAIDNVILTIEPGTVIEALDDGTLPLLIIDQGAKIVAIGNSNAPIVFTSSMDNPHEGSWGGIVINGRANINSGNTSGQENVLTGTFGGNILNDNSGTLQYIRIEYAGKLISSNNNLPGLSLNGVGSETDISFVQIYRSAGNGIEINGGTANIRNIICSEISHTGIRWNKGWNGYAQNVVVNSSNNYGIVGMNNNVDVLTVPNSNPTLTNMVILGANNDSIGIYLTQGTKCKIYNTIISEWNSIGVISDGIVSNDYLPNGHAILQNSIVHSNAGGSYSNYENCDTFLNEPSNSTNPPTFLSGYVGSQNSGSMDPSTIDSWFIPNNFIGAVESIDDWTTGWTK